jgi:uncharacterized protein YqgC (DUF456 family)
MGALGGILLVVAMLAGLAMIPFGFPGTAVILASVFIYALATHWVGIGPAFFVVLCILTLVSETADNWLTAVGAKHYGASTASAWLSLLGGLAGAIFLGVPLAVLFGPLGAVAGGFVGAFLIVVFYEYSKRRHWRPALRAGWGTFAGRMAGIMLKLVISIAMIVAVLIAIL